MTYFQPMKYKFGLMGNILKKYIASMKQHLYALCVLFIELNNDLLFNQHVFFKDDPKITVKLKKTVIGSFASHY